MSTLTMTTLLDAELAAVRGELTRMDGKASTLAGLAGAVTAFLVTQVGGDQPWPVKALLAAAGLALTTSAVLLLTRVLRPRLGATGFCKYAAMTSDDVRRDLLGLNPTGVHGHQATELVVLSRIATAKFRAQQRATDLLVAGLALTYAALVAGVFA